jgi:hypothetical protein
MTINSTGTAKDNDPLAVSVEVEQVLLRLLASREVWDARTQEETAIDAEDFWTQAE